MCPGMRLVDATSRARALSTAGRFGRLRRTRNRPAVGNALVFMALLPSLFHFRPANAARIHSG